MRVVHSLQSTIFLFFVALLLAVQAVFFQTIHDATRQQEKNQVNYQLNTAQTIFQAQFESRRYYLAAFAETAGKDFGLKQVFQEDIRSFLVALNNHRQRIDADVAIAISAKGEILAQLISERDANGNPKVRMGSEQGQSFRFGDWLEMPEGSHLYPLGQEFFQLSLAPIKSGELVIGWVGFGYRIDQRTANYFAKLTNLTTDFVIGNGSDWRLLSSSLGQLDDAALVQENTLVNQLMSNAPSDRYIVTHQDIGEVMGTRVAALMYGDRAHLLTEIRSHWLQLVLLAALTLCLSLAGAYFIAARISRPVRQLVSQAKQIAGGKYDVIVSVNAHGELKELAEEFNNMQQAVVSRERVISHQAFHDDLTGLPNRNRLVQVLDGWLEKDSANTIRQPLCIVKLSIRRIDEINSSLGHMVGDEVIKAVAQRLHRLADKDTLFHVGGSEFVLLKLDVGPAQISQYLALLLQVTEQEYRYQSILLYLELRLGVAFYPDHDGNANGLLQKSAVALSYAQKSNRPFVVYDSTLSDDSIEQLKLINELKAAIEGNQLVLHYQPKLDLNTGRIEQVEALVRWQHPGRGMIPPDKFIGIAEQTGMINALTRWVLLEAARQHKQWLTQGVRLAIAVNISAENLKHQQFYDTVVEVLHGNQLDTSALSLEMTESAVMGDLETALSVLRRFHHDGIQLSIDDYGTGYSSLTQLKQLPVSELKIDRSFVQKLLQNNDDQIIVRSTIELAHNMGLSVVAEGIEELDTLNWLRDCGCDQGQGYFICRPKPAGELITWLLNSEYFPVNKVVSS